MKIAQVLICTICGFKQVSAFLIEYYFKRLFSLYVLVQFWPTIVAYFQVSWNFNLCYPRMLPHRLVIFCRIYFENILKIFLYTFLCKNLSPFMAPPYLKGPWFKQVRTWIYTTYAFTYVWGFLAERYLRINIKKKLFFMTHLSWPSSTLIWKKNHL